jgi:hypothetical protein
MASITYLVGGVNTASKNLWEITDDGASLAVSNSWNIRGGVSDVTALAKDSNGNFYVGLSSGHVYKYDSNMTLLTGWAVNGIYDLGSPTSYPRALAVSAAGKLAVASVETGSSPYYGALLLDSDGALEWNVSYASGATDSNEEIAFDEDGNVIVGGTGASGQPIGWRLAAADGANEQSLWASSGARQCQGLAIRGDGLYVMAEYNSVSGSKIRTMQTDGTASWTTTFSSNILPATMAFDTTDNVSFVGGTRVSSKSVLRFDSDGNETHTYDTGGQARALAIDANDNLITE